MVVQVCLVVMVEMAVGGVFDVVVVDEGGKSR